MDDLTKLQSGPFSTAAALGLMTEDVLRGPRYRQLSHGAHQLAALGVDHGRRIEAFRTTHREDFVLLGHSAAWAHGVRDVDDQAPVVVAIPSKHRLRRTAHVTPHLARLTADEVVETPFGLATCAARTAVDLARGIGTRARPVATRVADVDSLLRASGLPAAEAREAAAGSRGLRGLTTAVDVLRRCCDGVDSRQETRLRLLVVGAGLPAPSTQCPVVLPGGRVVARLDLGWPERRVGLEYDGQVHVTPEQVRIDLRRHNLVREAGWRVLQVDRYQIRYPDEVLRQLFCLLNA